MFKLLKRSPALETPPPCGFDADTCRRLLSEHLDYITKICDKAVAPSDATSRHVLAGEGGHGYLVERPGQLDRDTLFNQVIDHLQEDNYRRLREFKGNSSITTYLTAIISRLVIDIVRSHTGRSRAKERAERHGPTGLALYEEVVQRHHSIDEAVEILQQNYGISITLSQAQQIIAEMQGRSSRHQIDADHETAWNDSGELVSIQYSTPEDQLSEQLQQRRRTEVLTELLQQLPPDERLLLRLKFPLDDTEPPGMQTIAAMAGLTAQQADRKLRRILQGCREMLLKKGMSLDDLL